MMSLPVLSCCIMLMLASAPNTAQGQGEKVEYSEEVKDELDGTKWGQCPVPHICRNGNKNDKSCGTAATDRSGDIVIDCSDREAGPYMPGFTFWVISRRTWQLDFSDNGITSLDDSSFMTDSGSPMNLTKLDLSHNYITKIDANTFNGNISLEMTELDLSHNSLRELEMGVFSQMPKLTSLKLSNNRLIAMDAVCGTAFTALSTLHLQYNMISKLPLSCLKDSTRDVSVNLGFNAIGSVDDCWISDKMSPVTLDGNPILCGCSSFSTSCYSFSGSADLASVSSQPSCKSSSTCLNVSYPVTYERVDSAPTEQFTVKITLANENAHKIDLVKYENLQNDTELTVTRVVSESDVTKMYSRQIEYGNEYSVCVTPGSDSEYRQRTCTLLQPPKFRDNSGNGLKAMLGLILPFSLFVIMQ